MTEAIRQQSNIWKALVALVLAVVMAFGTVTPSRADQAAVNRNVILGAAAIVAGIILYNNWYHKKLAHDTIVGYTPNGGVVYADGRVVYPNGTSYYMSNNGQVPCDYDNDGDGYQQCGPYATAYTWHHDNGLHRGWYKPHGRPAWSRQGDRDDEAYYQDRDDQRYYQDRDPRTLMPRTVAPRTVAPRTVAPRTVAPRSVARDSDDRHGRDDHGRRDRR